MKVWTVQYPGSEEFTLFTTRALAEASVRFSCHRLPPDEAEKEIMSAIIREVAVYEQVEHL
jgi:hypothetical protein